MFYLNHFINFHYFKYFFLQSINLVFVNRFKYSLNICFIFINFYYSYCYKTAIKLFFILFIIIKKSTFNYFFILQYSNKNFMHYIK